MLLGVEIGELYLIDADALGLQLHLLAIATKLVRTRTIHLASAICGWHLINVAHKLRKGLEHQLLGNVAPGVGVVHGVLAVVAIGGGTQLKGGGVFLGVALQFLNTLGASPRA